MPRRYLLTGSALLLLLALLIQAPARLLAFTLAPGDVVASGYAGTVWRGSVDSLALPVSGRYWQLGRVQWRVSPWALFWLSAEIELAGRWGRQEGRAELSVSPWRGLHLREVAVEVDAQMVRLILPVNLGGRLELSGRNLRFSESGVSAGSGRLNWRRAHWSGYRSSQQLGDYVLEFQVEGEQRLAGRVSSLSGPVLAEGQVGLNGREYSLDLHLRSDTPLASEFRSALELAAVPEDQGYRLKFSAEL